MGWKQYGKEATEERESGIPVRCREQYGKEATEEREIGMSLRCRSVTVRVRGVETVWEEATVKCMLVLQNRWSNSESSLPQKGLSLFFKKRATLFKQR